MSYWDPSLVRIARLETKVQGKKFGENQTLFLFIAMRNSNTCIDADETMPRVSFLTQASDAQDQLRGLLFRWTDIACARQNRIPGDISREVASKRYCFPSAGARNVSKRGNPQKMTYGERCGR